MTLTPSLSVSEVYNDNLFFSETDLERDFATYISPRMTLVYQSKNITLSSSYRGTLQLYSRRSDANQYAQAVAFDLGLPLLSRTIKGFDVQVTESISFTPELPAFSFADLPQEIGEEVPVSETRTLIAPDTFTAANEGIQVGRRDAFVNNAGITVSYGWSSRFNTSLSYTNQITLFKGSELQDSMNHNAGLETEYEWSDRTRLTASYRLGVSERQRGEAIIFHSFLIGVGHRISPALSGDINVGGTIIRDEPAQLNLRLQIAKNYELGSLSAQYYQAVGTGGGLATSATLSQRVLGRATRSLGRNITGFVRLAYSRNISLSGEDLDIRTFNAVTGVSVGLLSWLSGSLSYSYFNQQSRGIAGTDGERNQVMLTLGATIPSWRLVK